MLSPTQADEPGLVWDLLWHELDLLLGDVMNTKPLRDQEHGTCIVPSRGPKRRTLEFVLEYPGQDNELGTVDEKGQVKPRDNFESASSLPLVPAKEPLLQLCQKCRVGCPSE
jgi:hypothetical protein